MDTPLFIPFDIRNKIINEHGQGKDISEIPLKNKFETLSSYMDESYIHNSFIKRMVDGMSGKKVPFALNFDRFKKGLSDTIQDIKYTIDHPYSSLNCGFIINPYRFASAAFDKTDGKAYHKFNEASGDIINQATSGNGWNEGLGSAADMQVTGADYGATGIIGDALDFVRANSDYADYGTSLSQWNFMHSTTATWTWNYWLKFSSTSAQAAIWGNNSSITGHGISIAKNGNAAEFGINVWSGAEIVTGFATTGTIIPDTTNWHLYTITYDQSLSTDTMEIYRDNANKETANKTATVPTNGNATYAARMGNWAASYNQYLDATADEGTIFGRVFTSGERSDIYNSGSGLEL